MPARSQHKYEELSAVLRTKILTLSTGYRLPSVRSLMRHYQVSLQTVNSALAVLEKEGLIDLRPGSGIYVSDHRTVKLISLHRSRHPSAHEDAKEDSLRTAIHGKGWYLEVRRHEIRTDDPGAAITPEASACAHIVMQDIFHLKRELVDQLIGQKVPIVILGRESGEYPADYIADNDRLIVSHLIKHLHSLGHRRFALLVNEPSVYPEIRQRIETFNEMLEMMDLAPATLIDCETKPGEKSSHSARDGLKKYLDGLGRKRLPFTALLVNSSAGGFGALRALHECGIRSPEQCNVASIGAEDENTLSIPSLTDAGTPISMWGDWVVKVLQQRFDGDSAPSSANKLPIKLTARESTCRVRAKT